MKGKRDECRELRRRQTDYYDCLDWSEVFTWCEWTHSGPIHNKQTNALSQQQQSERKKRKRNKVSAFAKHHIDENEGTHHKSDKI